MPNIFSFSDPLNSGIDFYTADDFVLIDASLSIQSNVTVSAHRVVFGISSISGSVDTVVALSKVSFASSIISGALDVSLIAAFERQDALITISANSDVVTNITKFAHLASALSISSTVLSELTKIIHISSEQSGSVNTSSTVTKIAFGASSNSGLVDVAVSTTKIIHIASDISGLLDVSLLAVFERQDGSVNISGEVAVSTNITKISFAEIDQTPALQSSSVGVDAIKIAMTNSAISGDVTVANTTIKKVAFGVSALSSSVNTLATIMKIIFAATSLSSSVTLTTAGRIFLATIRINILNNTNISAQSIRFSSNIVSDSTLIRSLLLLDNKALTNQTRNFSINATPKFIEQSNWQGNVSRYYKNTTNNKGSKRTFNMEWSFIPNEASYTVDLKESRNFLKQTAQDSDIHVLTIINQDVNGVTPYTEENIDVFVTSYSENLIRRDLSSDSYYFSCNMALEEA